MSDRQLFGAHVPNENPLDLAGFLAMIGKDGPTTILDLNILRGDRPSGGGGRAWWELLRQDRPNAWIHVRLYDSDWRRVDPAARAERAVRELAFLMDDPFVTISAANEQDIESWHVYEMPFSQRPAAYEQIGRWQVRFWDAFWQRAPGARIRSQFAALAGGHDMTQNVPDSEYRHPAIRDAVQRCEVLGVHAYSDLRSYSFERATGGLIDYTLLRPWRPAGSASAADPGGAATQFPDKPLFVSECGSFKHPDPAHNGETMTLMRRLIDRASQGRTLGITLFVWSSDEANWVNAVQPRNPELARALLSLRSTRTSAMPGAAPAQPPARPPATGAFAPRVTAEVGAYVVAQPGEGGAKMAGRAAGWPNAPYSQRVAWWREVQAANGNVGSVKAGQAYRLPWFTVED